MITAELTEDYNERTSLSSFRFTLSIGGSILALLIAISVFQFVKDPAQQYLTNSKPDNAVRDDYLAARLRQRLTCNLTISPKIAGEPICQAVRH
nr:MULTISPECIES: MFS transporter [unclassified Chamaesiphon]